MAEQTVWHGLQDPPKLMFTFIFRIGCIPHTESSSERQTCGSLLRRHSGSNPRRASLDSWRLESFVGKSIGVWISPWGTSWWLYKRNPGPDVRMIWNNQADVSIERRLIIMIHYIAKMLIIYLSLPVVAEHNLCLLCISVYYCVFFPWKLETTQWFTNSSPGHACCDRDWWSSTHYRCFVSRRRWPWSSMSGS